MKALGEKIGRVLEIGEARLDYKRVRVDFLLDKAIMPTVRMKVQGHGMMEFVVRYENIPHFCFVCGRIGHAERECPEEADREGGVKFGTALRCSPQKREVGKRMTIPVGEHKSKRGINFSGDQKAKVLSGMGSSNRAYNGNPRGDHRTGRDSRQNGDDEAAAADLAKGVASMSMDTNGQVPSQQPEGAAKEKVSGLDSFMDSSYDTTASAENMSMRDRLIWARKSTVKRSAVQDGGSPSDTRVAMEVDKQKRGKEVGVEDIVGGAGFKPGGVSIVEHGISPAKCYKVLPTNLTGTHGESRQEK